MGNMHMYRDRLSGDDRALLLPPPFPDSLAHQVLYLAKQFENTLLIKYTYI